MLRFDVRGPDQVDPARVDDDQLGALAQPALHPEANTGWPSVGLAPMTMITSVLRTESKSWVPGRLAERGLEPEAGGRMADARAGVDVVVAECGAHELLHEVRFFVGAARGRDAADRIAAVLLLDAA